MYTALSVADHLRLGRELNPQWDDDFATGRVARLGLPPAQRAGRLSGGQRSQLALTLAMAKRPELLVLDEPVSSLDPLARREFLQDLMELVAEHQPTVVLSSHLLADVERVRDYLVVLANGRVRLEGSVDDLLATHKVLTGPRRDVDALPANQTAIRVSHTDRQSTMLVRTSDPILDPRWIVADIGLEDLVLVVHVGRSRAGSCARSRGGAAMTWVAWRQFRSQIAAAGVAAAAVCVVLLVTRGHVADVGDPDRLSKSYQYLRLLGTALIGVPAFVGAFWARRCSRANSKPAPTDSRGHRA